MVSRLSERAAVAHRRRCRRSHLSIYLERHCALQDVRTLERLSARTDKRLSVFPFPLSSRSRRNVVAVQVRILVNRDRCCCCYIRRDPFPHFFAFASRLVFPSSLLSFFLSFFLPSSLSSLRYYLLFTLFLLTSLSRFSLALHSFLLVLLLPLPVFLALSLSLSHPFLSSDVVSWGQCLLDRILSRNIPVEEEKEKQEEVEDDLSTLARDCNRRSERARATSSENRSAPFFAPRDGDSRTRVLCDDNEQHTQDVIAKSL